MSSSSLELHKDRHPAEQRQPHGARHHPTEQATPWTRPDPLLPPQLLPHAQRAGLSHQALAL